MKTIKLKFQLLPNFINEKYPRVIHIAQIPTFVGKSIERKDYMLSYLPIYFGHKRYTNMMLPWHQKEKIGCCIPILIQRVDSKQILNVYQIPGTDSIFFNLHNKKLKIIRSLGIAGIAGARYYEEVNKKLYINQSFTNTENATSTYSIVDIKMLLVEMQSKRKYKI